jgi:hypothetical protein
MTNPVSKFRVALASASLGALALAGGLSAQQLDDQAGPAAKALYAGTEQGDIDLYHLAPIPDYTPGRTSWGDPDLRGTWPTDSLGGLGFQRTPEQGNQVYLSEEEFAKREARMEGSRQAAAAETNANKLGMGNWVEMTGAGRRTSLLVDPPNGRLPEFTEYGKNMMAIGRSSWVAGQTYDWTTDFDSWDRCITRGFPGSMFPFRYNNGVRIFQSPGFVVIDLEMIHDSRIIPIVKKGEVKHNDPRVKEWMGDAVGWWEGNTLVIETTNIQPGASPLNMATIGAPPNNVIPNTDKAHSLERLTLAGPDTLVYEVTYTDPLVWTAPWTVRMDIPRNEDYEFYEYACHEGDVQVRNYISSSRALRGTDAAMKEGEEAAAN